MLSIKKDIMPYRNSESLNPKVQFAEILKDKIKTKHSFLLKSLNSGFNTLFWEIGAFINSRMKGRHNDEEDITNIIYLYLSPFFGDFLNFNNLILSRKFADKCDIPTLSKISSIINWDYIQYLVSLNEVDEWIFYTNLIHSESLSPIELKNRILADIYGKDNKGSADKEPSFMLSHTELFYESTLELYFGEKNFEAFRKLFEPNGDVNLIESLMKKNLPDEITSITQKIFDFQLTYNVNLNFEFNVLFWDIGKDLKSLGFSLESHVFDSCLETLNFKLKNVYPNVFAKEQLRDSIRFMQQDHLDDYQIELMLTLPWPYLRVLIIIEDIELRLYLARQVLKQKIAITDLQQIITNKDDNRNNPIFLVSNLTKSTKKRKVKEKNRLVTITEDIIEPIINPVNDINRNIYKNAELLEFLKNNLL